MPRTWPLTFALVGILTGISGCGSRYAGSSLSSSETLNWAIPFEFTSLDPAQATDGRSFDVLRQVYEGLVGFDRMGNATPGLASKWEVSSDKTQYLFHLSPGIKFSNGRPFEAADVVATFDRACRPTTRSPLAGDYLGDIAGVKEVVSGKSRHIVGIEAVDAHTVRVKLQGPRPSFLSKLAFPVCAILPRDTGEIISPAQMIGTGPFVPAMRSGTEMLLRRNDAYWRGRPSLAALHIRFVADPGTRINLFRSGAIDLTSVTPPDVPGIQKDAGLKASLVTTSRADVAYLQFNPTNFPVLGDKRVRQALALCIDRDRLAKVILGGLPKPAASLIPPGVPGHTDIALPRPDFVHARQLLADAGFPDGRGFPPISIVYQDAQRENAGAEAIVTAWRRELHIEANTQPMPASALIAANQAHRLPCFYTAWVGDYPDPDDFPSMLLRSTSASNGSSYRNNSVDAKLDAANLAVDTKTRTRFYGEAEAIALVDDPLVPLLYLSDAELVSSRLQALQFTAFGHGSFYQVSKK